MGKTEGIAVPNSSRWSSVRAKIGSLGLDTYEVGGSLRDELSGSEAHDVDVSVQGVSIDDLLDRLAQEGKVDILAVNGQAIGARLWASWAPADGIEFALARKESSTGDGHTDFLIDTGNVNIEDDLARRDFTVNAIARKINPDGSKGEIIDPFGGAEDVKNNVLRMVSEDTIAEDPLRVLRGLVRVAKDGYDIEPVTAEAMREHSANLAPDGPLAAERIFKETDKLIRASHAGKALRVARDIGVFENVFPELAPMVGFNQESKYHDLPVDDHCFRALERAEEFGASREVRWAALLHDSGKPETAFRGDDGRLHYYENPDVPGSATHEEKGAEIAGGLLRRLKAPRDLEHTVKLLVGEHMFGEASDMRKRSQVRNEIKARRFIQRVGRDHVHDLMMLRRCDSGGKRELDLEPGFEKKFEPFEQLVERQMSSPVHVKDLEISGHDLIGMGLKGREIGAMMNTLLERVVTDPSNNRNEKLVEWAGRLKRKIQTELELAR